jgi:hypothetical protein
MAGLVPALRRATTRSIPTDDKPAKERYRRDFSPDGVLGVSPIFLYIPQDWGIKGVD